MARSADACPLRFPERFVSLYRESAGERGAKVRLRHPDPPADAARASWRFRASDLDVAGHVNNAGYLAVVEEELLGAEPERLEVEVEYREPAQAGDLDLVRDGDRRWLVAGDRVCASILLGASAGA